MKEISVTDEFLTLDKTIINCQNEETLEDCKTRKYINTMVEQCKCLPFSIRTHDKVTFFLKQLIKVEILGSLFNCRPTQMCRKFKS